MPTKISLPNIDDLTLINTIVDERTREPNKSYFNNYKSSWKIRINEYNSHFGNPEKISATTIDSGDKSKFINLYEQPKNTIKVEIIDKLRDHDLDFCPFCGEAGTPSTLDHFLPKDTYPEYSLLSTNLVPMCDICQRADMKGTKVFDKTGRHRLFFHPYFDGSEELEILHLEILPPFDKKTNFLLSVNTAIKEPLKSVCIRHLETLHISDRYRKHFIRAFERLKKLVKQMIKRGQNPDNIPNIIYDFYIKEKMISVNYWDAIFYKSVLENKYLIEYLKVIHIEDYE